MSSHVPLYLSQEVSAVVRFRYISANGFDVLIESLQENKSMTFCAS